MKLVVLESPNKIKHVQQYLGTGYEVLATAGHFRDLPHDELGVDTSTFAPTYVIDPEKKDLLARIKSRAKEAEQVLLATDADREGEAISWHLAQELRLKQPMRLKYTEITEKALQQALGHPVPLDQNLVDAQQARRVLDRLVGYQVSPLLSQRFGKGQSAGRVQSATLHLVVLREIERESFQSQPYWTLSALYTEGFTARFATVAEDGKLTDTRFKSEAEATAIAERARVAQHIVQTVETKAAEGRPSAPFTTSTVQQAASSKLHFKPDRTMSLAQKLFEQGLITYHRTDSVALSDEAIEMARAFLTVDYPEAVPDKPVKYKVKGDAQGAHEAIRTTSLALDAAAALSGDELSLYQLIRNRFIACQCKPAILDRTTITIQAADTAWRATGSVVAFESWRKYLGSDTGNAEQKKEDEEDSAGDLPKVAPAQILNCSKIDVASKKTSPPGRYDEAGLVDAMEKSGIGRPATYANTVKTLFERTYLAEEKKHLYPTTAGRRIDTALGQSFPELLETSTTAELEKHLDEIAEGARPWKDEIRSWYIPFSQRLIAAGAILDAEAKKYPELAQQANGNTKPAGRDCPRCGRPLLVRTRKEGGGEFLACSGYKPLAGDPQPPCTYAADINVRPFGQPCPACGGPMEEIPDKYARCLKADCTGRIDRAPATDEKCPKCGSPMTDRGTFLGCSNYPGCKGTIDKKALQAGKKCPKCGKLMAQRKSAKGPFWGCTGYPECKHLEPIASKKDSKVARR